MGLREVRESLKVTQPVDDKSASRAGLLLCEGSPLALGAAAHSAGAQAGRHGGGWSSVLSQGGTWSE